MASGATPPPPPDPVATAAAQANANVKTAQTQQEFNMTDQVTPYGTLTYRQVGTWEDGTPKFEAVQSLSPAEQGLYDTYTTNQQKLGTVGGQQIDRVSELLARPVDLSNDATEARLLELGRKRLDPILAQRRDQLGTRLANQGITPGSEAWNIQMDQLGKSENDAYDNLLLTGRSQAVQEALTERNQPLNEIIALLSNSQVQQPSFAQTPQVNIAAPDVMGATYNSASLAQKNYATEEASKNAMMGGIFGLAAAPLGGWAYGGFKLPKAA